jgi:hypothetical protein
VGMSCLHRAQAHYRKAQHLRNLRSPPAVPGMHERRTTTTHDSAHAEAASGESNGTATPSLPTTAPPSSNRGAAVTMACSAREVELRHKVAKCFQELQEWQAAVSELDEIPAAARTPTVCASLGSMWLRLGHVSLAAAAYRVRTSSQDFVTTPGICFQLLCLVPAIILRSWQ